MTNNHNSTSSNSPMNLSSPNSINDEPEGLVAPLQQMLQVRPTASGSSRDLTPPPRRVWSPLQQQQQELLANSNTTTNSTRPSYDLTPVMRNTSGMPGVTSQDGSGVSPHDNDEDDDDDDLLLHGEHLAMPSSLDDNNGPTPCLPPLPHKRKTTATTHIPPPLALEAQMRNKSATFTNLKDFEKYKEEKSPTVVHGLTPYQPTRAWTTAMEEDDDVAVVPPPKSIFIARTPPQRKEQSGCCSCDNDEDIAQALALEDRTLSIPSLHMANALNGGESVASFTSYTDEEDSVLIPATTAPFPVSEDAPVAISDSFQPVVLAAPDRKRSKKDAKAFAWLQSLETNNIAEAASSKFLTQKTVLSRSPLKRQTSSPSAAH